MQDELKEIFINQKEFEVILEYGEILQERNFFNKNIGYALQQFRYISDGKKAVIHPHFTYYGFRYVRLTKWKGSVNIDDFIGCAVYSNLKIIGHFETDHSLVNRLVLNCLWSQKDNFSKKH